MILRKCNRSPLRAAIRRRDRLSRRAAPRRRATTSACAISSGRIMSRRSFCARLRTSVATSLPVPSLSATPCPSSGAVATPDAPASWPLVSRDECILSLLSLDLVCTTFCFTRPASIQKLSNRASNCSASSRHPAQTARRARRASSGKIAFTWVNAVIARSASATPRRRPLLRRCVIKPTTRATGPGSRPAKRVTRVMQRALQCGQQPLW